MMLSSAVVIVVGTAFIVTQVFLYAPVSRPQSNLPPYPGSTEGLDLVVVSGDLELSVVRTYIGTMDPHRGPTTMSCSLTVSLSNKGNESALDLQPMMGTLFDADSNVVYSFWVSMRLDGTQYARVVVPAARTVEVYCHDVGSFEIDNPWNYSSGYVRVQFLLCENQTVVVTTPLTQIMHAVE
jgi:hypothetical protein